MRLVETAGLAVGLTLASMMVGTWVDYANASPTDSATQAGEQLHVFGPDVPALAKGIAYWNGLAGRQILVLEESAVPAAPSAHDVLVTFDTLGADGQAGVTAGMVGEVASEIRIDVGYMNDWAVYVHELGHALGFNDYNTEMGYGAVDAAYKGVMSYKVWGSPDRGDDKALLSSSWLNETTDIGEGIALERGSK